MIEDAQATAAREHKVAHRAQADLVVIRKHLVSAHQVADGNADLFLDIHKILGSSSLLRTHCKHFKCSNDVHLLKMIEEGPGF